MKVFFERRYARFEQIVNIPLAEYYGMKNVSFVVNKLENELYIIIRYTRFQPTCFNVPFEINKLINSYCGDYIEIHAILACPKMFPFVSPVWNLAHVKHNFAMNLEKYYKYIVDITNESNIVNKNWSSIYGFEKEILRFFMRLNFDFFGLMHF